MKFVNGMHDCRPVRINGTTTSRVAVLEAVDDDILMQVVHHRGLQHALSSLSVVPAVPHPSSG